MASKSRLDLAAGKSIGNFFTNMEETEDLGKNKLQAGQEPDTSAASEQFYEISKEKKNTYRESVKPKKVVMGFRAIQDKIDIWKLYAEATEQEISLMCTNAIDEYIHNHRLSPKQQQIFDIKIKALEAERQIKNKK